VVNQRFGWFHRGLKPPRWSGKACFWKKANYNNKKGGGIMLPSEALNNNRKQILEILALYPLLKNLCVFGSVAKGHDTEDSDLDLVVETQRGTTLFDLGGLQEELQDLLKIPVHLTTFKSIPEDMRKHFLEGVKPI
jgi:predicted nucleotidyltransferase